MTKNYYSAKSSEHSNNKNVSDKLQLIFSVTMCLIIFIVSFLAFLKIENNLHAFLVFSIGTVMNAVILANGINQTKEQK